MTKGTNSRSLGRKRCGRDEGEEGEGRMLVFEGGGKGRGGERSMSLKLEEESASVSKGYLSVGPKCHRRSAYFEGEKIRKE